MRCVRVTNVAVEKQEVFYILMVGLLILVIQHVKRMHRIILQYVACLFLPYFQHCIVKGTIFGKPLLKIRRFF